MHQSKLFTLLRGLKPEEIRWFQKFLQSPFYNTNEKHIKLFDYIKKYYPELDSPKLSKEAACKKLFPKQSFNIQKIRKLMHGLTLLIEEFLVAMRVKNNAYQKKRLLVSELGKRNVYDLFEKGTEELLEELEDLSYRDEFYFSEYFQLENEFLSHPSINHNLETIQSIHNISNNLDKSFIIEKLRLACTLQSAKKMYKIDAELPYIEDFILKTNLNNSTATPVIQLYLSVYQMFKNTENESLFNELLENFLDKKLQLHHRDQEAILKHLINFSIYYINFGRKEYVKINFELYKIGIEANCLIKNNLVSNSTFKNIVVAACFLKKFDWTLKFIQDYEVYLNKENRDTIIAFNISYLYFHQGRFQKAITILNETKNTSTVLEKILGKTLLIKSYFEIFVQDYSYEIILLSHIDAYEKFIRREEQISVQNNIIFLNFAKAVRKLTHFFVDKRDLRSLKKEFADTKLLSNKAWLITKTEIKVGKSSFV